MKRDKPPLHARGYSGPGDLRAIIDLLIRVRPPDRLADCPSMVDLQEWFSLPDLHADTRLWFGEGGKLVAFAFADAFNNLRFEALPDVMRVLEEEAVSWGQECILRRPHGPGERITLDASCREDDAERIAMLRRNGFQALPIRTLHMVRALSEPIPQPVLPQGFAIRGVTGLDEAGALAALHRAAFGTEHMTTEERLSMMTTPEYDPSLDLVAVAPDGALAAYCMCFISAEENARAGRNDGCTDPVATHPRFQRQGLARALLLHGFRLLRARGMDFARLGTTSDNTAMQRAAQSVGYRLEFANVWFERPLRPAE